METKKNDLDIVRDAIVEWNNAIIDTILADGSKSYTPEELIFWLTSMNKCIKEYKKEDKNA